MVSRRSFLLGSLALGAGTACARRAATKSVVVRGSDTMIVLAQAWAETYARSTPDVRLLVSGGGTGTGIAALENGTADLATASRAITGDERARIERASGGEVVETRVALDAISIYVHPTNPVVALDLPTLAALFRGTLRRWPEVGGPEGRVVLYTRENSSGTYAYFKEHVLAKADFAAEAQSLPGTSGVVHAVASDPRGIGFAGVARSTGARVVPLRLPDGSLTSPSEDDAVSGRYPIARPLFVYGTRRASPEALAFVAWLGTEAARSLAARAGFFTPGGTT